MWTAGAYRNQEYQIKYVSLGAMWTAGAYRNQEKQVKNVNERER